MWKNIKKFFKWIADHTGISWVARKISSGWKWLFGGKASTAQQNTPQQGESPEGEERDQSKTTTPKTLDDEVNPDQSIPPAAPDEPQGPVINTSETDAKELPENFPTPNPKNADSDVLKEASNENYLKVGGKGLLLVLTSEQFAKCKDYQDSQSTSPGGLLMYIKCGENEYRITGANNDNLPNTICIKSILKKSKDGKYVNGNIVLVEEEIKHVKKMLELNNDGVVKVDSVSDKSFEVPTLEQPNSNVTSHNATQQVVNNEGVATELKKFFDAEDDGVTQPRSLTTDPAVEQSTPVSSSKAPTNGTLPKVASPSETKNGSNNGAVVLYQMLHDQGRLHPSPELYDYLLRASLVKEMLFCKVAPNSLFTQPIPKQVTGNDHSR
ncbi:MAG: hypothetical protein ACEY3F_02670 [Wolbachia sp.]